MSPGPTPAAYCKGQKGLLERGWLLTYLMLVGLTTLQGYVIGVLLRSGGNERYQSVTMAVIDELFEVNIYKAPLRDPLYIKALCRMSSASLLVAVCASVLVFSSYSSLYVLHSLVPVLCLPLFLLPQTFLVTPARPDDSGLDGYATAVIVVYDCLAFHALLYCPVSTALRAIIRYVCWPKLAEIICLHIVTSDCPAVATGAWLVSDWTSFLLLQAELAAVFLSSKHNFTKVVSTQLNFLPLGFAVAVFGKAAHLRLLGIAASLRLVSQVSF